MYAIPVTAACIVHAADEYKLPKQLIKAVMAEEGGWVGLAKRDSNGSIDYGPMQINSLWLKRLKPAGITAHMLRFNGCLNVTVGAWILSGISRRTETYAQALGYYHSSNYQLAHKYVIHAEWAMRERSWKSIILGANRLFTHPVSASTGESHVSP